MDEKRLKGVYLNYRERIAYRELYQNHYEDICAYLYKYTSDYDKVDDAVQEAFVTLWERRNRIDVDTSLKSYLYKMAYNNLMSSFREQKKTNSFLQEYYQSAIEKFNDAERNEEDSKLLRLKQCLKALPERCAEIFKANKISGMPYRQVAHEYKISIKTVEYHVANGYKLLKKCMFS